MVEITGRDGTSVRHLRRLSPWLRGPIRQAVGSWRDTAVMETYRQRLDQRFYIQGNVLTPCIFDESDVDFRCSVSKLQNVSQL